MNKVVYNRNSIIIIIFFTLGIKDPEGFGKKLEENVSEWPLLRAVLNTQKNHVAARRWIAALARKRAGTKKAVARSSPLLLFFFVLGRYIPEEGKN